MFTTVYTNLSIAIVNLLRPFFMYCPSTAGRATRAVYVIAWVAVKFGINTTSVVLKVGKFHEVSEITHFQYHKSGIY